MCCKKTQTQTHTSSYSEKLDPDSISLHGAKESNYKNDAFTGSVKIGTRFHHILKSLNFAYYR